MREQILQSGKIVLITFIFSALIMILMKKIAFHIGATDVPTEKEPDVLRPSATASDQAMISLSVRQLMMKEKPQANPKRSFRMHVRLKSVPQP